MAPRGPARVLGKGREQGFVGQDVDAPGETKRCLGKQFDRGGTENVRPEVAAARMRNPR